MTAPADFTVADEAGRRTLRFTGALTLARLQDLPARLDQVAPAPAAVDLSGIERMDTVGAWVVHRLVRDHQVEVRGADESQSHLLEQVAAADKPLKVRPDRRTPFLRVMAQIGDATMAAGNTLFGLLGFFGGTLQ